MPVGVCCVFITQKQATFPKDEMMINTAGTCGSSTAFGAEDAIDALSDSRITFAVRKTAFLYRLQASGYASAMPPIEIIIRAALTQDNADLAALALADDDAKLLLRTSKSKTKTAANAQTLMSIVAFALNTFPITASAVLAQRLTQARYDAILGVSTTPAVALEAISCHASDNPRYSFKGAAARSVVAWALCAHSVLESPHVVVTLTKNMYGSEAALAAVHDCLCTSQPVLLFSLLAQLLPGYSDALLIRSPIASKWWAVVVDVHARFPAEAACALASVTADNAFAADRVRRGMAAASAYYGVSVVGS